MQPRPRVLAVAQSADLGGAELALIRIAGRLPELGFDVELAVPGDGATAGAAGAMPVHRLPVGGIRARAWPRAVAGWPRARRLARGFDCVVLNGIVTQRLAPALWTTTLVPYIHEISDDAPRAWRSVRYWRAAPTVLCSSRAVAERCRALGAPSGRLRVVYAPVDAATTAPRPAWADGRVVGFAGRLEPHKAVLDLVRAMRMVDARLVVVGDGRGAYAEQLRAEAGERVTFAGPVANAAALMAWFDVLAVPSPRESFGLVAAEALAAGTPVVAARSGGIEEIVVPGRNGALVPAGEPEALAQALNEVLPVAASMADAAREDAARFASERVAADVADALRDALARRAGRTAVPQPRQDAA